MDLKKNINKIDYDLSQNFKEYSISEKSSLKFGKYFEISVVESSNVKIVVPFKNIDQGSSIDWYYYSNPLNENSNLVNRKSSIADFLSRYPAVFGIM